MTSRIYKTLLATWLLTPIFYGLQSYAASLSEAKALSWTVHTRAALLKSFPDIASVNEFLSDVVPHDDLTHVTTSEYTFADLNADGSLELIASLSDGGEKGYYPTVAVVTKSAGGFTLSEAYNGGGMDVPPVNKMLVSIPGHEGVALLLPRRPGPYLGARPTPIVYDVYEFKDHRIRRSNLKFSDFYTTSLLPQLRAEIRQKQAALSTGDANIDHRLEAEVAAQQAGIDAMDKMLKTGTIPSCVYGRTNPSSTLKVTCIP